MAWKVTSENENSGPKTNAPKSNWRVTRYGFEEGEKPPHNPSLAQIGGGLATEIAVGEGTKFGAAAAGTAIAGPIGFGVGYVTGAVIGGISGSIAAQRIEGRKDLSYGRIVADTLLNLLPGGSGKVAKGSKVLPKLAKVATKRAAGGAAISSVASQIEVGVDEGRSLTPDELARVAGTGAALGLGLGVTGDLLANSYKKFAGKPTKYLDEAYDQGDHDAIMVIESIVGEKKLGAAQRKMKMIAAKASPTNILGKDVSEDVMHMKDAADAASSIASDVRKRLQNITKDWTESQKEHLDDYMSKTIKGIQKDKFLNDSAKAPDNINIDEAIELADQVRDKISDWQVSIYKLYKNGAIELNPAVANKIKKSIDTGDYFTRDYRFFEDSSYEPTLELEAKLRKAMLPLLEGDDYERNIKFNEMIQRFKELRESQEYFGFLNLIEGGKIFKKRKELIPELREYLGEYKGVDEKAFGTLIRLGRNVAKYEGQQEIAKSLIRNGLAGVRRSGEVVKNAEPLMISSTSGIRLKSKFKPTEQQLKEHRGQLSTGRELGKVGESQYRADPDLTERMRTVYALPQVNEAIKDLLSNGSILDNHTLFDNVIGRSLSTTTAFSKFAKVPLNLASWSTQFIGNAVMVAGQGMNPFKLYGKGFRVAMSDFSKGGYIDKIMKNNFTVEDFAELKKYGIIDKGVLASDIRNGFKRGLIGEKLQKLTRPIGKLYNVFDTAQRIVVFENYKGLIKNWIPEDQYNKLVDSNNLNKIASELTNATYQNYDRINKNLRAMSRLGIMNEFAAFNFEQVRTIFNQGRMVRQMVNGEFASHMKKRHKIDLNQDALTKEGIKRFVALSGIITAGSVGLAAMNRSGGISAKEEKAYRDTVLAPWEKDQALYLRRDGDELSVANFSYQIPHAELTSIFESGFRGADFEESLGNFINSVYSKFGGSLTINLKNIVQAVSNRDIDSGDQITARAGLLNIWDRGAYYIKGTFTPGTINDFKNFGKRSTGENALRYVAGYRSRRVKPERGFYYRVRSIKDHLRTIRSQYTNALYRSQNPAQDYVTLNETYTRRLRDLRSHVNDLRILNIEVDDYDLSDDKIIGLLKKQKISNQDVRSVMTGDIKPMPISAGISGSKAKRIQDYVNISRNMPMEMVSQMLREDYENNKIKKSDVRKIMNAIQLNRIEDK